MKLELVSKNPSPPPTGTMWNYKRAPFHLVVSMGHKMCLYLGSLFSQEGDKSSSSECRLWNGIQFVLLCPSSASYWRAHNYGENILVKSIIRGLAKSHAYFCTFHQQIHNQKKKSDLEFYRFLSIVNLPDSLKVLCTRNTKLGKEL